MSQNIQITSQTQVSNSNKPIPKTPTYMNRLPPCNNACPAGNNIQAWLKHVQDGHLYEAWETIMRTNPFPAVHGRICYHPCENACNRSRLDNSINIHATERFLGDLALQENWQIRNNSQATNKKILIVGAGPAGLSAAYHLKRLGHDITIFEAKGFAGGMMHTGIPAFRLPREILEKEIKRIENLGVKIEYNRMIQDLSIEKEQGKFDAVFIGSGAEIDKRVDIKGANNIYGAIDWLTAFELKKLPQLGKSIAVYGGGNTALDVARTAKRLGVQDVNIIYRRDRVHMPAFPTEVEEAEEEGVKIHFLHTIKEQQGSMLILEIMEMQDGKPQSTGKFEQMQTDMLVLALGQDPNTDFLQNLPNIIRKDDGSIVVENNYMTNCKGIFAGGDVITSNRSVTIAVGHGRKAALQIDAYLRDITYTQLAKSELAAYSLLHLEFYDESTKLNSTKAIQPMLTKETRSQNFNEIVGSLTKEQFFNEANRCLLCGNCFECDGCYNICPVNAISKNLSSQRSTCYPYKVEKTCIHCAKCYKRCPCGAITMK